MLRIFEFSSHRNPLGSLKNKIIHIWEVFSSKNTSTKISITAITTMAILALTILPTVIKQQTNTSSHASNSLYTNCIQPPAGITQQQLQQRTQSKGINWCNSSALRSQTKTAGSSNWTIYTNNPIMTPTLPSEGDNIYAPEVHKEGNVWKMWYGGQAADGHDRIHYAISTDGITWQKYGVVIQNNGFYGTSPIHNNDPTVVSVNGTYYMYYTEWNGTDRIMLATSTDGTNWQKQGIVLDVTPNEWGTVWTSRPSAEYENGVFKLWYDSVDSATNTRDVGYATSTDGIHFQKSSANPVLTNAGAVDVKRIGNQYILVFEGKDGTYWATSPDEIHFVNQGLLFGLSGGTQDKYGQITPMIYVDGTGLWTRTYFGGASGSLWNQNRIFMASNGSIPQPTIIQGFKPFVCNILCQAGYQCVPGQNNQPTCVPINSPTSLPTQVTPTPAPTTILNENWSTKTLDGWQFYLNPTGNSLKYNTIFQYSNTFSVLTYNPTDIAHNSDLQLFHDNNLSLIQGKRYHISVDMAAINASPVTINLTATNANALTSTTVTIPGGNQWNTYGFDYTPSVSQPARLALNLGAVNGLVYIGTITVKQN